MSKTVLYLGQKEIGEKCFEMLFKMYQNGELNLVVCSNISKNCWWGSNNIYTLCKENSIPFFDNSEKNEDIMLRCIEKYNVEMIISVQHNWILSDRILKSVNYNALNLHLAKLPEYQGYNTFNNAILNDEDFYGVTLHWMTENVDYGDIAYYKEIEIEKTDTAFSLYKKSVILGIDCFRKFLSDLKLDDIPRKKMLGKKKFYDRYSLNQKKCIIDLSDKQYIAKLSRAMYFPPFEGAYFISGNDKYYIIPEVKKDDN